MNTKTVPRIDTARLVLRGPLFEDFAAYAAMWGDADVVRHITGEPLNRETAWAKFLRDAGHWALTGYGFWCIAETASNRYAGQVGFANFKRDLEPAFGDDLEMGWSLARWAHGQGYAAEAARAAIDWAEQNLARRRIVCMINEDNAPSIRLARAIGFRDYARTDYKGKAVLLLER
jgi:RimJ/RimL family protein N-acetyltransferase